MEPRNKRTAQQDRTGAPASEQQNWNAVEGASIVAAEGEADGATERDGTLPEEDDDNAYQSFSSDRVGVRASGISGKYWGNRKMQ